MMFSKAPYKTYLDDDPIKLSVSSGDDGYTLLAPSGRHRLRVLSETPGLYLVEFTSFVSASFIVIVRPPFQRSSGHPLSLHHHQPADASFPALFLAARGKLAPKGLRMISGIPIDLIFIVSVLLIWFMLMYQFILAFAGYLYSRESNRERKFLDGQTFDVPSLSIMIPAHNEELVIERTLKTFLACDYPLSKLEIIVLNDGSTDQHPCDPGPIGKGASLYSRRPYSERGRGKRQSRCLEPRIETRAA